MCDEVAAAVARTPRAVTAAEAATRVEAAAAEEAATTPVVLAVVATAAVADLLTTVGDATGGATSGRSAPRRRATLSEYAGCSGLGHEESTCSSDAAVLTMKLSMSEEDLAVKAQAFVAKETCKCSMMVGEEVGGGELGKQVVQYIADSTATCNMTPDADGIINYRECSQPPCLANGKTTSIAGYGELTIIFRSDNGWGHVKLHDVAHAPLLSYNLISLPSLALKGHTYAGDKDGAALKLKGGKTAYFPLIGKLCPQYGYRPEAEDRVVYTACAVIAPGQAKAPTTPTDINTFHCTYGHIHDVLLNKTAE